MPAELQYEAEKRSIEDFGARVLPGGLLECGGCPAICRPANFCRQSIWAAEMACHGYRALGSWQFLQNLNKSPAECAEVRLV